MIIYLYIGLGSALGGMTRHLVCTWMAAKLPGAMPCGTLTVNVVGSFLIGLVTGFPAGKWLDLPGSATRQFLTIGFLGGFTTFSAFSMQSVTLLQDGKAPVSVLYVLLSVALCLAAAATGYFCGTGGFTPRP